MRVCLRVEKTAAMVECGVASKTWIEGTPRFKVLIPYHFIVIGGTTGTGINQACGRS